MLFTFAVGVAMVLAVRAGGLPRGEPWRSRTSTASWASVGALPVLVAASRGLPCVRRLPWLFYAFYPAHLAAFGSRGPGLVPTG